MRKILFRCDGGSLPEIGTGHVVRCLLLADKLRGSKEFDVAFLMKDYAEGIKYVVDRGYKVYKIPLERDELEEIVNTIKNFSPEILVIDKLDTKEDYMKKIKKTGVVVITLDDVGPGQKYADITINAILESGISLYEGPRYIVLPKMKHKEIKEIEPKDVKRIFLSFGGYDYLNITLKAMKALENLDERIEIIVVIGGAYKYQNELNNFLKQSKRNFSAYFQPKNFSELFDQADMAIVSGGLTLFEAMARGIPSMVVAQYEHQTETARKYEDRGATIYLGNGNSLDDKTVYARVNELIKNKDLRKSLMKNGMLLVDGLGLERVFNLVRIVSILEWDTAFFGFKTARLHPLRLNEDIIKYAINYCKKEDVDVMYYLADCHDPLSVKLAEKYSFHFTDIRLTFNLDLEDYTPKKVGNGFIIRESSLNDIPALRKIAEKSHVDSRYYFDQNYPREACEKFYSDWIEKSCRGFADKVFIAEMNGRIVGYITCNKKPNVNSPRGCGEIILVGVGESAREKNIGTNLIYRALNWFHDEKIRKVTVVTQGRNYGAQRLYQKCGFKTILTQLWYHKWFKKNHGG